MSPAMRHDSVQLLCRGFGSAQAAVAYKQRVDERWTLVRFSSKFRFQVPSSMFQVWN
jgi:hypothetical protein